MASFNMVVLEIALAILIICLALIGWGIYSMEHGSQVKYPPVVGDCPDFWTNYYDTDTKIDYCENKVKVGTNIGDPKCMKFPTKAYNTPCKQFNLAYNCGISWDGISDNQEYIKKCNKGP